MAFTQSHNNLERVLSRESVCFINNLHPELLLCIFEFRSFDDDDDDEGVVETDEPSLNSIHPPLLSPTVLSHVCRHWRNVTLSAPSLWTTIQVSPAAHRSYEFESMMLERSKTLPIDLQVNGSFSRDAYASSSNIDFTSLLSILVPHIHRCRTIEVTVWQYHSMHLFLSAVSDHSVLAAPHLRTLKLVSKRVAGHDSSFDPSWLKRLTLSAGSAPFLTTLILWAVDVDWSQPWILSAPNLTSLVLVHHTEDVRPSWAQFMTILRGASSLEKLWLCGSGPSGHIESPTDLDAPIQLSRLTYLRIDDIPEVRVTALFRKLSLPALKNLVLNLGGGDCSEVARELARPATLQGAQERPRSLLSGLTDLTMSDLPCHDDCVAMLYGELENLRMLHVSVYDTSLFLDILGTPRPSSGRGGVWLPRLETLYVSGSTGDALCEVVQRRREFGAPLSSVYIWEWDEVEKEEFEWLRENLNTVEYWYG